MCEPENITELRATYLETVWEAQGTTSARRKVLKERADGMCRAFGILHPELPGLGEDR